jgi:hypothetical protein
MLQHLTNQEIQLVLERLKDYPHVIVTESIPVGPKVEYSRDKVHGPDIRLYSKSGVFLDKPPFNLLSEELLRIPVSAHEAIVTTLIRSV